MTHHVPEGALARAGSPGRPPSNSASAIKPSGEASFLSQAECEADRQALDDRQARLLFDTLSKLRGTALKVAQMLCMEAELLPEAYRRELEKSCHRVPPLNRVLVRKALIEEFGQPPEVLFAEFDAEAFAAASLGQVHAGSCMTAVASQSRFSIPASMSPSIAILR